MIGTWLTHEVRLQVRNGLYGIYGAVNLFYLFLLGYVPEEGKELALTMIIFSDPTVLGMIFIGAFILLEKVGGVTEGIAISPLGAQRYIIGKVASMGLISLITSLVLAMSVKGIQFNVGGFVLTVIVSSMLFTMLGILTAVYTQTINHYLVVIIGIGTILTLPLLDYFKLINIPLARLVPTYQVFGLIEKSIKGQSVVHFSMGYLLVILGIVYGLTVHKVNHKLFGGS
jgi:fluoroquinolone transport system permease protein